MNKQDWLWLLKHNPAAFGIDAGYDKLTDLHNDWIIKFLHSKVDTTTLAHRGSYKTTCLTIALALGIIAYPDETACFLRKTDDDVKEVIRSVKNLLKTNMIQACSVCLYGRPVILTLDSMTIIDTNLKVGISGTPQITAFGSKSSITGKHYDKIATDDIVTLKDRISRAEREQIKIIYQELENVKNPNGRFVNTGSPWHKEDCIEIMPNVERFDCYQTGLLTPEQIRKKRSGMSASLFAANYELKHIADENALFRDCQFYDGDSKDIEQGIGHIDAAYGGGDFSAYTIVKVKDDKIIVFGKVWEKHIDKCLNEIALYHTQYKAGTIHLEKNADKGYLAKQIDFAPTSSYHEDMNKFIKISSWLKKYWENIYFISETDPEYIDMILEYSEYAEHDDAPDSLASLIRIIKGRPQPKVVRKPAGL